MRHEAWLVPIAFLGGCDTHGRSGGGDNRAGVHVAAEDGNGLSVSVPGLDARLSLPGMDLSRHVDLDGIKLAPGTRIRTMDVVDGHGTDGGTVRLAFFSPRPPAALMAYYRQAADRAGFAPGPAGGATLTANKGGRRFSLAAAPDGQGSTGTIAMEGE